jgi:YbbR domain-containing protein
MMAKLWRAFASNITSALLALLLALVSWLAAVYEAAPPRTDYLPAVPLKVINLGEQLIISTEIPSEVKVQVRALSTTWEQLSAAKFTTTLDLAGLGAGEHSVQIQLATTDPDVVLLGSEPEQVSVTLEQTSSRKLRVRVKVLDEENIPLGYISRLPVVSPDQITVSGRSSGVALIAEAVIEVSLKNARETVVKQEAPTLLDEEGNRVQGLGMSPGSVTVTVQIERQVGYRDVTVRAVTTGAPAAGYWTSNITVEPALVTVYGQQSVIEGLPGYLDTQALDVQDATRDIIQRVALALPEGVLVLGDGAGKEGILVQVSVQPLLGGQTMRRELTIENLRAGLQATSSLTHVDVILSGPLPALQELKPEDVHVTLDLLGLPRGTHKVTPKITLPEGLGLEVKSVVPDVVEVVIE